MIIAVLQKQNHTWILMDNFFLVISVTSNVFSWFIVLSGLMMDSASSLSRSSCKFFSVSNEYSWKRNHLIMHHYVKYKNERNIIHVAYKE